MDNLKDISEKCCYFDAVNPTFKGRKMLSLRVKFVVKVTLILTPLY